MLRFTLLFVALFGLSSAGDLPMRWYKQIAEANLKSNCWGEENMQQFYLQIKDASEKCMQLRPVFDIELFDEPMKNPFNTLPAFDDDDESNFVRRPENAQLGNLLQSLFEQYKESGSAGNFRGKRALVEKTEEDAAKFRENFADLKMSMKDNIGNLTCVLARTGALDSDLNVDMDFFTRRLWTGLKGIRSDIKEKAIEIYEDCDAIAKAFPRSVLNKMPLSKRFGRQMIFFKCQMKWEKKLCALNEISTGLKQWYGDDVEDPSALAEFGLPTDRLKAAYMIMKVMEHGYTEQEQFLHKFFSYHKE